MFGFFNGNKKITETLYEQNLELAVKNKTLSLLEKLYQTSVLNLTPEEMAQAITDAIRLNLNLEFAGVFIFEKDSDSLKSLAFSKSERLVLTLNKLGFLFSEIKIPDVSKRDFFKETIFNKKYNITNDLGSVWEGLIKPEHLNQIKKESHIKTIMLDPLIADGQVIGALLLSLNRDYNTLSSFEKSSVRSFVNVIGLLLDKAYLYKNLQESYEVTKRAYAVEKQAKEELEKLDKVKDQFVMITQHNLRTPLTSMMGYSDLLLKGMFGKQNKKTTEVIKKFQTLTQSMIKMVNDFLDMAQFQLGKNVVALKPGVEVLPILDEIVGELKFKADTRKVYLTLEKPEKVFTIKADREKLKASIFNIIDNAIKYTEKGGVTIKVQNHDAVKIIVSDTGIGIPKDKLESIFTQMFQRTEQAKKVASDGAGVGLYLSAQIIKSHNGKVWVESEGEGKGSTFYVELPLSTDETKN